MRGKFNKKQSVLKNVYIEFSTNDPGELKGLYMNEDQKLMKTKQWDYNNTNLVPNKIKNAIEKIGISNITDEKEKEWISDILWMWNHHAISCALWRYGDKKTAQKYSTKALSLQSSDHPNKITRLLHLLTMDEFNNAKQWAKTIKEEPEKTTAKHLLELYKNGNFFKPQIFFCKKHTLDYTKNI